VKRSITFALPFNGRDFSKTSFEINSRKKFAGKKKSITFAVPFNGTDFSNKRF